MPILAGILVQVFTVFAQFFGMYFTRKVAVGLAGATAVGVLFTAIILCMRGIVLELLGAISLSGPLAMGVGICFPIHSALCIASIATSWACTVLFKWQKTSLDIFVKA